MALLKEFRLPLIAVAGTPFWQMPKAKGENFFSLSSEATPLQWRTKPLPLRSRRL